MSERENIFDEDDEDKLRNYRLRFLYMLTKYLSNWDQGSNPDVTLRDPLSKPDFK